MASSTEKVTYEGRCHCGAIAFTAKLPQLEAPTLNPVLHCNCSICHRNGYLLVYPLKTDLEITKGEDQINKYRAFEGTAPHVFCRTCASSLWIDPTRHPRGDVYCLNVRMLRGVDLDKLKYDPYDGKSNNQPKYNDQYW